MRSLISRTIRVRAKNVKNPKSQLTLSIVYFFLISQIVFGIDFGFTNSLKKKYRKLVKYLTSFISVSYILILIAPLWVTYDEIWSWIDLLEYTAYFIILRNTKYTLYNLMIDAKTLTDIRRVDKIVFNVISNVQTGVMLCLKSAFMFMSCTYGKKPFCQKYYVAYYYFFYSLPNLGLDVIIVGQVTIFYYIFCFMRNVKEALKNGLSVEMLAERYKKIADTYDRIRPLSDNLLALEVCIGLPKLIATFWTMLLYIRLSPGQWFAYGGQIVFASHIAVQVLIPAVFSEMIQAQVDEVKLILNEQLMSGVDERTSKDIVRILSYLEVRKLQRPVWRFIPTDLRLVLSLFNVCISYFIVIIQFTHLYD